MPTLMVVWGYVWAEIEKFWKRFHIVRRAYYFSGKIGITVIFLGCTGLHMFA